MRLFATVVGSEWIAETNVEPDDTVATALEGVAQYIQRCRQPHEFTAYTAKMTDDQWLSSGVFDFHALQFGEPSAVARYTTETGRLDSSKRVVDYFGTTEMHQHDMIVLEWTAASRALSKQWEWIEAEHEDKRIVRTPVPAAPPTSLEITLAVMLAGFHQEIYDIVDTIASVLRHTVQQHYYRFGRPHEFTAYMAKKPNGEWLCEDELDFYGLDLDDPATLARYLTPAARLDPRKTVAEYFGTQDATKWISIVLQWHGHGDSQTLLPSASLWECVLSCLPGTHET